MFEFKTAAKLNKIERNTKKKPIFLLFPRKSPFIHSDSILGFPAIEREMARLKSR